MAAQARPHALIIVAHSPGSKGSDEAWTPPCVFLRGVAQQFEAELICCGSLNEHSEKSISKSCGAEVASASSLHKLAREGEAVPLVVLVADEAGLGSIDQADRLALRKIISDCRTCIVDAKAANGSLFWFEGLFDGAKIPRELGREIYGGLDFWLVEIYCKLEGRADFTPYDVSAHRNFLYTQGLDPLDRWQKRFAAKAPTLAQQVERLLRLAKERDLPKPNPRAERLITSPLMVLFEGQKLDLRDRKSVSQVLPIGQLRVLLAEQHRGSKVKDVIVGLDKKKPLDLSGVKIDRLTTSTPSGYDVLHLLDQPNRISLEGLLDDDETLRKITSLIDAAPVVLCQGSMVFLLAAAGLLDAREAAVAPADIDDVRRRFPKVSWVDEATLARDGKFVTQTVNDGTRSFAHAVLALDAESAAAEARAEAARELEKKRELERSIKPLPRRRSSAADLPPLPPDATLEAILSHLQARLKCPGQLTCKGASEEDIRALETRLGEALPADFVEFLRYSDGLVRLPGDGVRDDSGECVDDEEQDHAETQDEEEEDDCENDEEDDASAQDDAQSSVSAQRDNHQVEDYEASDDSEKGNYDDEGMYVELKSCAQLDWDRVYFTVCSDEDDDSILPLAVEPEFIRRGEREACSMSAPFQQRPDEFDERGLLELSDDAEYNIWLVSPKMVRFARDQAGADLEWEWGSDVGWRVICWTHWGITMYLYRSFTEYLRAVAMGKPGLNDERRASNTMQDLISHARNAPCGPSRLAGGPALLEPSQPPLVASTQSASAMHEANYAVTAQDAVTLERALQTSPRTA